MGFHMTLGPAASPGNEGRRDDAGREGDRDGADFGPSVIPRDAFPLSRAGPRRAGALAFATADDSVIVASDGRCFTAEMTRGSWQTATPSM